MRGRSTASSGGSTRTRTTSTSLRKRWGCLRPVRAQPPKPTAGPLIEREPSSGAPLPNVTRPAVWNASSRLTDEVSPTLRYLGARNPTGPGDMHTDSAEVFARTDICWPAPGSRTNTRFSPGRTGTLVSGPSGSDIVSDPSLLAR